MNVPQVAIVGRPNVGKSSIFNWLIGSRVSIVDDVAGVTRDRVSGFLTHDDFTFELVDTGGIGVVDVDNLTEHVDSQIQIAIDIATVVIFVVDGREQLTPLDVEVAQRLRPLDKPVLLVANKVDAQKFANYLGEFHKLGFGEPLQTSVHQNTGQPELLRAIIEQFPEELRGMGVGEPTMKLAIVGRRNVGKSTFVNALAQQERMIVSEIPGTTRDSVDVRFVMDGKPFIAIDTPGLKRKSSIADNLEFYSYARAQKSIRRADVVLVFFDASDEVSRVDKKLLDYVLEQSKPCIFVANKWDLLVDKCETGEYAQYLRDEFPTMEYVPIAFITGKSGKNVKMLINHAQSLFKQSLQRVGTGELNRIVRDAMLRNPPSVYKQRRPKIFYASQVGVQPPTIVCFCSDSEAVAPNYRKYLENYLRDQLPFSEIPMRVHFRRRRSDDGSSTPSQADEGE